MPQSLSCVLVHLVFSTKNRQSLIERSAWDEVHRYIAGTLSNEMCPPIAVGGVGDHVHAFFGLSRTLSISQVAEKTKTSSSKWLKTKLSNPDFAWQHGYGAFSVSSDDAEAVARYIKDQEHHHLLETYQDEVRRLMRKSGIDWDERYVWD